MKFAEDIIFSKTEVGKEELSKLELTILPKALRNILLVVDGKTELRTYRKALGESELVNSIGTIDQCFETLLGLSMVNAHGIKINNKTTTSIPDNPQPKQEPQKQLSYKDKQFFDKIRTTILDCIESDLGTNGWQASLDLERCENHQMLMNTIADILSGKQSDLSKNSQNIFIDSHKKLQSYLSQGI